MLTVIVLLAAFAGFIIAVALAYVIGLGIGMILRRLIDGAEALIRRSAAS